RRAAMWSLNTIMGAGALGVEVTISGKLRTERAHFEKHTIGVVPKSGEVSDKIVKTGISHVLTKMGLMGIQLRIASKEALPQEFELKNGNADVQTSAETTAIEPGPETGQSSKNEESTTIQEEKGVKQNAQT
ncbi:MAG: 30S ribosomal protein S3, partial [Thermoproteota archaeon]|nr:30S ribosomal protein S3 [Thermoproteota archaeon]